MTAVSPAHPQRTLAHPRPGATAAWLTIAALAAAGCAAVANLRINVATFVDSWRNAADFAARMFPLDFPPLSELLTKADGGRIDASILRQLLIALAMIGVMLLRPRGLWPSPEHGKSAPRNVK